MEMYIWEIRIEVEYSTSWKNTDGTKGKETWTEEERYTVAASSGLGAFEKAKSLAKEFQPFDNEDDREEGEPIKTTAFSKVTDLVYLNLKETLDG